MTTYDHLLEGALELHCALCASNGEDAGHEGHDHGLTLPVATDAVSNGMLLTSVGTAFEPDPVLTSLAAGQELPIDGPVQDAFGFGVTVVDTVGGISADVIEVFQTITELALSTWSSFLGAAEGASLEVQVNVGGTDAVASAGPGGIFFDRALDTNGSGVFDTGDFVLAIAGSLLEMQTGEDPNGDEADIIVNVNEELLEGGVFFFDTTLTEQVPDDQFDFYSVILHELGHGLGFFGLADAPGEGQLPVIDFGDEETPILAEVGMLYDFLTETTEDGGAVFTGANVQAVYGESAPLEYLTGSGGSDISHFQALTNPNGDATDLRVALMNPFVIPGDRVEIGDLELALFADIGHTITNVNNQLINEFDPLPEEAIPTAAPLNGASIDGGDVVFTIGLDGLPPFLSIASGVAVAVIAQDGTILRDRALFQPGETTAEARFDAAAVLTTSLDDRRGTQVSETIEISLYNPTQAQLEGGVNSAVFAVEVEGTFGTSEADFLRGGGGDDRLFSGDGDDRLIGGDGDDVLDGGAGRDRLYGGSGNDVLLAGAGDDRVVAGDGDDTVEGGGGRDVVSGGDGADLVFGDGGDDVIRLDDGDDLAFAGAGDDDLRGGDGDDTLVAGEGTDVLAGGGGADVFDVAGGEETIITDLDFAEGDALAVAEGLITSADVLVNTYLGFEGVTGFNDGDDLVILIGEAQRVVIEDFGVIDAG